MAFPSATIDVTYRTTLDISCGTGSKGLGTTLVLHSTAGTTGIHVFFDSTTEQVDISGAAHYSIGTQATAVGIASYSSTLIDVDVGVIFLAV